MFCACYGAGGGPVAVVLPDLAGGKARTANSNATLLLPGNSNARITADQLSGRRPRTPPPDADQRPGGPFTPARRSLRVPSEKLRDKRTWIPVGLHIMFCGLADLGEGGSWAEPGGAPGAQGSREQSAEDAKADGKRDDARRDQGAEMDSHGAVRTPSRRRDCQAKERRRRIP